MFVGIIFLWIFIFMDFAGRGFGDMNSGFLRFPLFSINVICRPKFSQIQSDSLKFAKVKSNENLYRQKFIKVVINGNSCLLP